MLVAALFLQGCGGAAGVDAGAGSGGGAAAPPATSTWCAIDGTDTGNGQRADEAYYKSLNATAAK